MSLFKALSPCPAPGLGGDGDAAPPGYVRGRGRVGEGRWEEEPAAFYSEAHLQTFSKRPINN